MRCSMFDTPDRSDLVPNHRPTDENDVVDVGWCNGVLSDGRPYRAEYWVQEQLTLVTFLFSTSGIENYSDEQHSHLIEAENLIEFRGDKRSVGSMVIKDASENEMWSITFCIQDPYETYLDTNLKFNNY